MPSRAYAPFGGAYLVPGNPLTELTIRNLRPPHAGQVTLWDSLPRFGVRLSPGGAKTFVVVLGSGRRHTIGHYPTISLSQARDEARRILAQHTLGHSRPRSIPFDEARRLFLEACKRKNKPRTVSDYMRLLKRHFPFGGIQLSDIATHDITKRLDRLASTPAEQNYALVAIKIFFNWAVGRHYIDRSPCANLKKSKRHAKDRVLTNEELSTVWSAARDIGWPYGTIVQLLILTGQRRGEIAALRWDWIDQQERTISLPASLTKNSRHHTFPYGPVTAELLKSVPQLGDALFPARGNPDACFSGWSKCKALLDTRCKIAPWTLHDLRRTFATNLAALNTPPHVVEKFLNHASGSIAGVAAIYNRFQYMDEMRAAMAAWEYTLTTLPNS